MILLRMRTPKNAPIGPVQLAVLRMVGGKPENAEAKPGEVTSRDKIREHVFSDLVAARQLRLQWLSGGRNKYTLTPEGKQTLQAAAKGTVKTSKAPTTGAKRAPRGSLLAAQRAKAKANGKRRTTKRVSIRRKRYAA